MLQHYRITINGEGMRQDPQFAHIAYPENTRSSYGCRRKCFMHFSFLAFRVATDGDRERAHAETYAQMTFFPNEISTRDASRYNFVYFLSWQCLCVCARSGMCVCLFAEPTSLIMTTREMMTRKYQIKATVCIPACLPYLLWRSRIPTLQMLVSYAK